MRSALAVLMLLSGCAELQRFDEAYRANRGDQRQFQAEQARLAQTMVSRGAREGQPASPTPVGPTAVWTGRSQPAQSVTGVMGFDCEFNYAGRTFWRMFQTCPSSIQIQ